MEVDFEKLKRRAEHVRLEIMTTERSYVGKIKKLKELLLDANVAAAIAEVQLGVGVREIDSLVQTNVQLLADLEIEYAKQEGGQLGSCFALFAPFLGVYSVYLNQLNMEALIGLRSRPWYGELQSLLIEPAQRLPRYELLLRELFKCAIDDHDKDRVGAALKKIQETTTAVNHKKGEALKKAGVVAVAERIVNVPCAIKIVEPHRLLLGEAEMMVYREEAPAAEHMHVVVFNDVIICAQIIASSTKESNALLFVESIELDNKPLPVCPPSPSDNEMLVQLTSCCEGRCWLFQSIPEDTRSRDLAQIIVESATVRAVVDKDTRLQNSKTFLRRGTRQGRVGVCSINEDEEKFAKIDFNSRWKPQWAILKSAVLYLYETSRSASWALSMIPIGGCVASVEPWGDGVVLAIRRQNRKTYLLNAKTPLAAKCWAETLNIAASTSEGLKTPSLHDLITVDLPIKFECKICGGAFKRGTLYYRCDICSTCVHIECVSQISTKCELNPKSPSLSSLSLSASGSQPNPTTTQSPAASVASPTANTDSATATATANSTDSSQQDSQSPMAIKITELMEQLGSNKQPIVDTVCQKIIEYANQDDKFVDAACKGKMVELMVTHLASSNQEIRLRVAKTLKTLAVYPVVKAAAVDGGAIEKLLVMMNSTDKSFQRHGADALCVIVEDNNKYAEIANRIMKEGGVAPFVQHIKDGSNLPLRAAAAGTLAHLTLHASHQDPMPAAVGLMLRELLHPNAIQAIQAAITESSSPSLQRESVRLVYALAKCPNSSEMVRQNGVMAALKALAEWGTDVSLRSMARQALAALQSQKK